MSATVTFRLDPESAQILRQLMRRNKATKSQVIKDALRQRWQSEEEASRPTAWEIYSQLKIPPAKGPRRDRARHAKRLVKEILLAKRRAGTL